MCVCVYVSVRPSIHQSIHPPIHPSIHPPIHPSIHASIHPSIHPFFYPSILHPSSNVSIQPFTHISMYLNTHSAIHSNTTTHPCTHAICSLSHLATHPPTHLGTSHPLTCAFALLYIFIHPLATIRPSTHIGHVLFSKHRASSQPPRPPPVSGKSQFPSWQHTPMELNRRRQASHAAGGG